MMTSLKRIIKIGWKEFSRNIGLSIATLLIMVMVISLVTMLFILNPVSKQIISDVEKRVDVSVYFKENALEEDITNAQLEISKISEVKEISYISKDQALEIFIDKHREDPLLIESLTELGYNPFLPSLNIKAWEPSQYEQIANFFESGEMSEIIDKVDYHQRKSVIEKLFALTDGINNMGLFFSIFFGIIAILIAFNTTRIAIYSSKEEISVMRLVGASNSFIRGPFIVQGAIIGFIAAIVTFFITLGLSYGFDARVQTIAPGISILSIFLNNIFLLLLIQLATGVGLGIISSCIAIRKYLKI